MKGMQDKFKSQLE